MSRTRFPLRLAALPLLLGAALAAPQVLADPPATPDQTRPSHAVGASDQIFLDVLLTAGNTNLQAVELARTRSQDRDILALADTLETDHRKLNERLEGVAGGVRPFGPPSTASGAQHGNLPEPEPAGRMTAADEALATLAGLQGADFDRAFLQMLSMQHEKVIDQCQQALTGTRNGAEVQGIARDALPTLRDHAGRVSRLMRDRGIAKP